MNAYIKIERIEMPIKVTVDYIDDSGTPESELRGNLAKLFGDTTHINISPTSTNPETCISFGISTLSFKSLIFKWLKPCCWTDFNEI